LPGKKGNYHAKIGGNMVAVYYYVWGMVRYAEYKAKGGGGVFIMLRLEGGCGILLHCGK